MSQKNIYRVRVQAWVEIHVTADDEAQAKTFAMDAICENEVNDIFNIDSKTLEIKQLDQKVYVGSEDLDPGHLVPVVAKHEPDNTAVFHTSKGGPPLEEACLDDTGDYVWARTRALQGYRVEVQRSECDWQWTDPFGDCWIDTSNKWRKRKP